jgi:ectoine hydroxylase-related dioxygenase (phytanoyl-CoA dioxygenase family)
MPWVENAIREFEARGFCVLQSHLDSQLIKACRESFWPRLLAYIETAEPNRGPHRHFLPMPFEPPCFSPKFFFDPDILAIVRGLMDDRIVADQWGCDTPVRGSEHQSPHVDYQRPLFPETPDALFPPYAIVVSFGLVPIATETGPLEIAPGTHRMARSEADRAVASGAVKLQSVPLEIGDVLIRHPWAVHRGTPNITDTPRALVTIRYVRRWYADASRDVEPIPRTVWNSLSTEQQAIMRFPLR